MCVLIAALPLPIGVYEAHGSLNVSGRQYIPARVQQRREATTILLDARGTASSGFRSSRVELSRALPRHLLASTPLARAAVRARASAQHTSANADRWDFARSSGAIGRVPADSEIPGRVHDCHHVWQ